MSADSPRRNVRGVPSVVPPQIVSDRSIIDSVAGFINDVTLANQPIGDPKDTINWARFESAADISDPRFGDDWELEGNVAPPLLLILGYGLGVQVWAIPANGEAVEVLTWRHGIVSALRILPTPNGDENCRADDPIDLFADNRPLMAVCEGCGTSSNNPQFCSVNFISLKCGEQMKTIKFKNPVLDILANRTSVVITFHERIAVFDARTLEDRLTVTTCFPSPGINPNPVALGARWLAYSENKLLPSKRSGGGCDGDGVSSYTATVLNAAKSLGKGLRELGEQVAAGLTGVNPSNAMSSKSVSFDAVSGDIRQPGVVTILDIKHPIKDNSPTSGTPISINGNDPIVAHFIAHSEAIVAMEFDNSGMMLLTCDKRGHDFHMFRIQPHPVGSTLAAVHHLYVLHRGDTSAKVQNISFSLDSRWVAVSTLRGTTHVFPITPYGGAAGVRTHTSLHVVNKLSRFHRSAGLTADGRSSSPISHSDSTNFSQQLMPYHNPTMPPFPRPTVVQPLAQLRQPFTLGSPPGSAQNSYTKGAVSSKDNRDRQRLSSLSDDNGKPLSVCAVFAKSRSWLLDAPNVTREGPAHKIQRKAVDSLFVMAGHGALIQYDLDTKLASNVAKEKICDDTAIELDVEAKAQWNLGRRDHSTELIPPLSSDNWLIKDRYSCMLSDSTRHLEDNDDRDSWLSQVEIITHAGPHRRLWMGPQFVFKTYNTPSGSNLSHIESEAVEIGVSSSSGGNCRPGRSSPLNMPLTAAGRSTVPVLIESGSYSSIEQSPKLMDRFRHDHMDSDFGVAHGESRLKEDLADAMRESPSVSHKDTGLTPVQKSSSPSSLTSSSSSSSVATTVAKSASNSSKYESLESLASLGSASGGCGGSNQNKKCISIEKVVNPLGTVTTVTSSPNDYDDDMDPNSPYGNFTADDYVIHENCDESLFRPVVAIFCDDKINLVNALTEEDMEFKKPPESISTKLIVPVIEKSVDIMLSKKELKQKNAAASARNAATAAAVSAANEKKSKELSLSNQKAKSLSSKSKTNYDVERSLRKETHDLEVSSKQTRKGENKKLRKSEEKQTQVSDDLQSLSNSQLDTVFTPRKSSCRNSEERQIKTTNDDFENKIKIPVREYCEPISPQLQATNDHQESNLSKSIEVNIISEDIKIYDEMFLEPEEVPIKFERMTRKIKADETAKVNKKDNSYSDRKEDKEYEGVSQSLGENIKINETGDIKNPKSSSKRETTYVNLPIPASRAFTAPHNKRVEKNDSSDIEILENSNVKDKKLKQNKIPDGSATVLSKSDKSESKYKIKTIEVDSETFRTDRGEESAIGIRKKSFKKIQNLKESLSDLENISAATPNSNKNSGDIEDKDKEFAWGSALTEDLTTIETDNDHQDMFKPFEVDKLSFIKQKSPSPVTVTIKWPKRDKLNNNDKGQTELSDKFEKTDKSKRFEDESNFKEKKLKKNKNFELSKSDKSEYKYKNKSLEVDLEGLKPDAEDVAIEGKKCSSKKNQIIKEKLNDLEDENTACVSTDGLKTIKTDNDYQDIIKQFLVDKKSVKETSPTPIAATIPPPSPLKSVDNSNFNNCDDDLDHDSLIIFESPQKEINEDTTSDDKSVVKNKESSAGKKLPFPGYTADNLIFALCGSLHYENEYTNKSEPGSPLTMSASDSTQSKDDYLVNRNVAKEHNKNKYKNLDRSYQENVLSSSSISDETEASGESGGGGNETASLSCKKNKHRRKKVVENSNTEDDEELRPLINSDANSASSMTVSIAKGDDDDDTLQSLINSATIISPQKKLNTVVATKITKAITETLPLSLDNNQASDSSSSDQFATSTSEEPSEPDDNLLKSKLKDEQKIFNSDDVIASNENIINKGNEKIPIQASPVNSSTATVTATASTTAQLLPQPQQSQKKRSRRRKR